MFKAPLHPLMLVTSLETIREKPMQEDLVLSTLYLPEIIKLMQILSVLMTWLMMMDTYYITLHFLSFSMLL